LFTKILNLKKGVLQYQLDNFMLYLAIWIFVQVVRLL